MSDLYIYKGFEDDHSFLRNRSAPQDEGHGEFRIIRNGKLHAHAATPGEAKALIRRCQNVVGKIDRWSVMDGRTVVYRERAGGPQ